MKSIDVYVLSEASTRVSDRGAVCYRMEYGEHALNDTVEYGDHARYGAVLEGLLAAVRRVKGAVDIRVHVNSPMIAAQIRSRNFNTWNGRGGKTAKGEPVKEWDLWNALYVSLAQTNSTMVSADTDIPEEKGQIMRMKLKRR